MMLQWGRVQTDAEGAYVPAASAPVSALQWGRVQTDAEGDTFG